MDWSTLNFENLANGLLAVIIGLLSWLGFKGGRKDKSGDGKTENMELAGAVIDNKKADQLIEAFEDLGEAIKANSDALRRMHDRVGEEMSETRAHMRDLMRGKS